MEAAATSKSKDAQRASGERAEAPAAGDGEAATRGRCRNCGARLTGPFCAACGQEARERVVSLRRLAAEALGNLVSFDTRFWRTLGPFLGRPGFLANEYLGGRRKRYLPPLRLYIFVSFAFFLFMSFTGFEKDAREGYEDASENETPVDTTATPADAAQAAGGEEERSIPAISTFEEKFDAASNDFDDIFRGRVPVVFFLAVPLLGGILKLLYCRSGRFYVQHLILALHVQAFAFVAFAGIMLLAEVVTALLPKPPVVLWMITILGTVATYLLLSLRRVYGQPWWKSAVKTLLVVVCYVPVLTAAVFLILLGAALLFY